MKSQDDLRRYELLAKKWLDGSITEKEKEEFAAWYRAGQDDSLDIPPSFAESEEAHRERILYHIKEIIKDDKGKINKLRPLRWISVAAACIVLLGAPCAYFHIRNKIEKQQVLVLQKKQLKNDVPPGGNKAMLTLSDGSKVILNDTKNGIITRQGGTVLDKSRDNQLVYESVAKVHADQPVVYNTITTPKGGQFQVVLSDGSKIWLNAASSITFPTVFGKNDRKVSITGEVYFEVAKDKTRPFGVTSGKQVVEVLGTHFNINAYDEEPTIRTTLAEGSVKVSTGDKTVILRPEEQAEVSNTGGRGISVHTVDTDDVLAWKNGNFVFEDADIPYIMRQVSRWYDVSVRYEGDVTRQRFTGSIARNVNLSELLKMLKYSGIHFWINNNTIMVNADQ